MSPLEVRVYMYYDDNTFKDNYMVKNTRIKP